MESTHTLEMLKLWGLGSDLPKIALFCPDTVLLSLYIAFVDVIVSQYVVLVVCSVN